MHIKSHTKFQLGFSKFLFFNGQYGQDRGTASLCQILSKSFEPWPRYGNFSILDFKNFKIFNGRNGQEGGTASLCQISSKSLEMRPRYAVFGFFKMAVAAILNF